MDLVCPECKCVVYEDPCPHCGSDTIPVEAED